MTRETGRFCLYFGFLLWEKFQPLVLLVRKAQQRSGDHGVGERKEVITDQGPPML